MKALVGDKVRLRSGVLAGQRGTVEAVERGHLLVRVDDLPGLETMAPEAVTNYSLAARKAWQTEPKRAVGRRKGTKLCDRVSVTLRIDRELWGLFVALERSGSIEDRTATINGWLRA